MPQKKEPSWEEKIDKKMKDVEKKIEELGETIGTRGEDWGKKVEKKAKAFAEKVEKDGHGGQSIFWGIVLIVIGFLWLGRNLGWFLFNIPWFPLILIAVGIYVVLKYWDRNENDEGKPGKG